jgi:hypothetical protein
MDADHYLNPNPPDMSIQPCARTSARELCIECALLRTASESRVAAGCVGVYMELFL